MERGHAPARLEDLFDEAWVAEDGWWIYYTTQPVHGGPHHGTYVAQLFRPGRGGHLSRAEKVLCETRDEAHQRATRWFREHSPRWAGRNPVT